MTTDNPLIEILTSPSSELKLSNNTVISVSLDTFSNESFVLAWKEFVNDTYKLYTRTYNSDNAPLTAQYLVYSHPFISDINVKVIDNNYLLVWSSLQNYYSSWEINVKTSHMIQNNITSNLFHLNSTRNHQGQFELLSVQSYLFFSYFFNDTHVNIEKYFIQNISLSNKKSIPLVFSQFARMFLKFNEVNSITLAINSPDQNRIDISYYDINTLEEIGIVYSLKESQELILMDVQNNILLLGLYNNIYFQSCLEDTENQYPIFLVQKILNNITSIDNKIIISNSSNQILNQINIISDDVFATSILDSNNTTVKLFNFLGDELNTTISTSSVQQRTFQAQGAPLLPILVTAVISRLSALFNEKRLADYELDQYSGNELSNIKIIPRSEAIFAADLSLYAQKQKEIRAQNIEDLEFRKLQQITSDNNNTLTSFLYTNIDKHYGIWRNYNYDTNSVSLKFYNSDSQNNILIHSDRYITQATLLKDSDSDNFYVPYSAYSLSDIKFRIFAAKYTKPGQALTTPYMFSETSPEFHEGSYASTTDSQNNIILVYTSTSDTLKVRKISSTGQVMYDKSIDISIGTPFLAKIKTNNNNQAIITYGMPIYAKMNIIIYDSNGNEICSTQINDKFSNFKLSVVNQNYLPSLFVVAWQNNYGIPIDEYAQPYYQVFDKQCNKYYEFLNWVDYVKTFFDPRIEISNKLTIAKKGELSDIKLIDKSFLLVTFSIEKQIQSFIYYKNEIWVPKINGKAMPELNPALSTNLKTKPENIEIYYQTDFSLKQGTENNKPPSEIATFYISYEVDKEVTMGQLDFIRLEGEYDV